MCKREKKLQASSIKNINYGEDVILTQSEISEFLSSDLGVKTLKKDSDGWTIFGGAKISIKNISYLGFKRGAVRSHKKRIQFSNKLIPSFQDDRLDKFILGHYINSEGERLYVKFSLKEGKVGKSKSSHVSVYDLQNALDLGTFSKIDKRGNYIEVFRPEFLKGKLALSVENPFKDFAEYIKTNKIWKYDKCYKEMKTANFKNARQTMWAGWYLEFLAEGFFKNYKNVTAPYAKKIGAWKPDAFYKVPVEMKFHKEEKNDIPGNDYDGVLEAIKKYDKISLFVVNGAVELESERNEVDRFRKELFGLKYIKNPKHRKLKKKIKITDIGWCDIDIDRFNELKMFKQGVQPDGSARKAKLMYDANKLDFKF